MERKLLALGCPNISNVYEDVGLQKLICYLEENVFRQCYGKGRNFVYTEDVTEFNEKLPKYLESLNCPLEVVNGIKEELVNWILDIAIDKAYVIEGANTVTALNLETINNQKGKVMEMENHLKESIQLSSGEFREKLKDFLVFLGLSKVDHKENGVLLKTILSYIDEALKNGKRPLEKCDYLNLDDLPAINDDKSLDHAFKIINLLNVNQFRELQTKINELIVNVQSITADPKTDLKLGKRPNILVTGARGTGKSTFAPKIAEKCGLTFMDINKMILEFKLHSGYDNDGKDFILDKRQLQNHLKEYFDETHREGGLVINYHEFGFLPKRWFDIVVVLRCDFTQLDDQLKTRNYSEKKLRDTLNVKSLERSPMTQKSPTKNVGYMN
ncbi:unnamed protein product [Bursaphelenchus okinawaensis]|uniref:Uncharacterized protein n=1 Tax=Bursaphelenchus okinawaensis TaxID=465554 RepID=A0A811KWY0_9BILA|nr:unnamed protein product [Bursaphelenchus okinawaensis]CAG9113178.1 unnamed protein product [Bursaphelenchus okinawaensis]